MKNYIVSVLETEYRANRYLVQADSEEDAIEEFKKCNVELVDSECIEYGEEYEIEDVSVCD